MVGPTMDLRVAMTTGEKKAYKPYFQKNEKKTNIAT